MNHELQTDVSTITLPCLICLLTDLFEFRIKYKICLLTFNALNDRGPQYLLEMLTTKNVDYGLRSHEALTLNIPQTKWKTLGDRTFKVAAPKLWNSLPEDVCSSNDVSVFVN